MYHLFVNYSWLFAQPLVCIDNMCTIVCKTIVGCLLSHSCVLITCVPFVCKTIVGCLLSHSCVLITCVPFVCKTIVGCLLSHSCVLITCVPFVCKTIVGCLLSMKHCNVCEFLKTILSGHTEYIWVIL